MSGDAGVDEVRAGDTGADVSTDEAPARPALRIVRGEPSPEELAALVAVLASAGGEGGEGSKEHSSTSAGPDSRWSSRASLVRAPVRSGPGGWRASAFPT